MTPQDGVAPTKKDSPAVAIKYYIFLQTAIKQCIVEIYFFSFERLFHI